MTDAKRPTGCIAGFRKIGARGAAGVRSLLGDTGGSFVINFAVSAPIVLSAIFGVIELGRLGFSKAALQYAAEEATRYAIVNEGTVSTADIEAYAASKLTGVFDKGTAVIAAAAPLDPVTGTSLISVQVNYTYQFMLPFLPHDGIRLQGISSGFIAFAPGAPST